MWRKLHTETDFHHVAVKIHKTRNSIHNGFFAHMPNVYLFFSYQVIITQNASRPGSQQPQNAANKSRRFLLLIHTFLSFPESPLNCSLLYMFCSCHYGMCYHHIALKHLCSKGYCFCMFLLPLMPIYKRRAAGLTPAFPASSLCACSWFL